MEQYRKISNEKQIDYNVINLIKEHAKKYQYAIDKKDFLRKVSALEQKYILLDSTNPYEVLCYLEELDLKSSKLVLNELNLDEIKSILDCFSSEDKRNFYEKFSHLELVNQFIQYDKNAEDHVDDLSFDRKLNLLDSSSEETVLASSKIYDSMTDKEQVVAETKISTTDGIAALHESKTNEGKEETNITITNKEEAQKLRVNQKEEKVEKETKQEENKKEEQKREEKKEELKKEKEHKEEQIKKVDKYSIIGNGESSISIVSNPDVVKEFNQKEQQAEAMELNQLFMLAKKQNSNNLIKNNIDNEKNEEIEQNKSL